MLEQIISYIFVFILGIFFAQRNSYFKAMEAILYSASEDLIKYTKNLSLNFKLRFDTYYDLCLVKLKEKDFNGAKKYLDFLKSITEEFLNKGETNDKTKII